MLLRCANRLLSNVGYEVRRANVGAALSESRLAGLERPATVLDVGVAAGTPELYAAFAESHLVLVEPLVDLYSGEMERVKARYRHVSVVEAAAGCKSGKAAINVVQGRPARSSMLERDVMTRGSDRTVRREIQVCTLD